MSGQCPQCRGQQRDTLLCARCLAEIASALDLIAPAPSWGGIEAELELSLRRGGKSAPNLGGGISSERPLPFDEGASEAARLLRCVLAYWVHYLFDPFLHGPREAWPVDTVPAMAEWLKTRLQRIRQLDDPCQAHEDITGAVRACLAVIDQRPGRQLKVREIPPDIVAEALLTAREVCDTFDGVGRQRFRNWTARGRIEPVTVDMLGRPLFKVSDVQRLLCKCRPPMAQCAVQHAGRVQSLA